MANFKVWAENSDNLADITTQESEQTDGVLRVEEGLIQGDSVKSDEINSILRQNSLMTTALAEAFLSTDNIKYTTNKNELIELLKQRIASGYIYGQGAPSTNNVSLLQKYIDLNTNEIWQYFQTNGWQKIVELRLKTKIITQSTSIFLQESSNPCYVLIFGGGGCGTGGGGGGGQFSYKALENTPYKLNITIGKGGAYDPISESNISGGTSSCTAYFTKIEPVSVAALGGRSGGQGRNDNGGNGGSGGGGAVNANGGTGFQFGGGGSGGEDDSYSSLVACYGGNGGTYGGGGGSSGKAETGGQSTGYGGQGGIAGQFGQDGLPFSMEKFKEIFFGFEDPTLKNISGALGKGGTFPETSDTIKYATSGGGGGGGFGGNGGNGGEGYAISYKYWGGGGGGGGLCGDGGNGFYAGGGGGGGGYYAKGGDGNSIYGGGGGGYGLAGTGGSVKCPDGGIAAGGFGCGNSKFEPEQFGNGGDGICVIYYYELNNCEVIV